MSRRQDSTSQRCESFDFRNGDVGLLAYESELEGRAGEFGKDADHAALDDVGRDRRREGRRRRPVFSTASRSPYTLLKLTAILRSRRTGSR